MNRTLIRTILLSVLCLWFNGCGGDTGGVYTASVSFMDGGEDNNTVFDVTQSVCTPAVGTTPAEMEVFTDVIAVISLSVDDGMPALKINSYSLEYYPRDSVGYDGVIVTPPTLQSLIGESGDGSNNVHIDTNSTAEFPITCFSISQKYEYYYLTEGAYDLINNTTGAAPPDGYADPGTPYYTLGNSTYTIRIVLHCTDDSGYDRDIEIRRTVYLGRYSRC